MNSDLFFIKLRSDFQNEVDYQRILRIFRLNTLLWKKLYEKDFLDFLRNNLDPEIHSWSPASIGLLSVTSRPFQNELPLQSINTLPENLRKQGEKTYLSLRESNFNASISMDDATLIAIYFAEEVSRIDEWLKQPANESIDDDATIFIFSIIIGLVDNPDELVKTFITSYRNEKFTRRLIRAIFCHPFESENLYSFIYSIYSSLSITNRIWFLNELKPYSSDLVKRIIDAEHIISDFCPTQTNSISSTLETLANKIYLAELASYEERTDLQAIYTEEVSLLCKSIQNTNYINHALSLINFHSNQHSFIYNNELSTEDIFCSVDILKIAYEFDPTDTTINALLILLLVKIGKIKESQDLLNSFEKSNPSEINDPSILVASALIAFFSNETESCTKKAKIAISIYGNYPENQLHHNTLFLVALLEIFDKLKIENEQIKVLRILSSLMPDCNGLNLLYAKTHFSLGNYLSAIEILMYIITSDSKDAEAYELLIYAFELLNEWQAAYEERLRFKEINGYDNNSILLNEAYCALRADEPGIAAKICNQLLGDIDSDKQDDQLEIGTLFWLLGETSLKLSDPKKAIEDEKIALESNPGLPFAWIALATCYRMLDDFDKSENILLRAINALPHSFEIALELGILYLEREEPSKALNYLENAMRLSGFDPFPFDKDIIKIDTPCWERINHKPRIEYYLGKAFYCLGYADEGNKLSKNSIKYLEKSIIESPESMYGYAKSVLRFNQKSDAIPVLRKIIRLQPGNNQARLDLATAIVETSQNQESLEEVVSILNALNTHLEVLSEDDQLEVNLVLAETLIKLGKYLPASDIFQNLINKYEIRDTNNELRIYWGLADAALGLKDYDLAITFLQECIKLNPEDKNSLEKLSYAYLKKGLINNSLQTAYSIYRINPSDLDVIRWYANHCHNLLEISEEPNSLLNSTALQILEKAIEISPSDPDLLLVQAEFYQASKQISSASQTLVKLLSLSALSWRQAHQAAQKLIHFGETEKAQALFSRAIDLFITTKELVVFDSSDSNIKKTKNNNLTSTYSAEILFSEYAYLLVELGDLEKAIEILNKGLENLPGSSHLSIAKSKLLTKSGKNEEAIQFLSSAIEQNTSDFSFLVDTAYFYLQNGRLHLALEIIHYAYSKSEIINEASNHLKVLLGMADISFLALDFDNAEIYYQNFIQNDPNNNTGIEHNLILKLILYDQINVHTGLINFDDKQLHISQLAIQTRLLAEEAGIYIALSSDIGTNFQNKLNNLIGNDIFELIITSQIALSLGLWNPGIKLTERLIKNFPEVPISQYLYAKMLVLVKQINHICNFLKIDKHRPQYPEHVDSASLLEDIIQCLNKYHDISINTDLLPSFLTTIKPRFNQSDYWSKISETLNYLEELRKTTFSLEVPIESNYFIKMRNNFRNNQISHIITSIFLFYLNNSSWTDEIIDNIFIDYPHPLIYIAGAIGENSSIRSQRITSQIPHLSTIYKGQWVLSEPVYYSLLAYLNKNQKNYPESLSQILRALLIWPDEPEWHLTAAKFYLEQSNYQPQEAISHLKNAIEENKYNPLLYESLSDVYLDLGDVNRAVEILEEGLELSPDSSLLWICSAELYRLLKMDTETSRSIDKLNIIINMEDTDLLIRKYYLEADICMHNGLFDQSIEIAKGILEIDNTQAHAYEIISFAHQNKNNNMDALSALNKAIERSDNPISLEIRKLSILEKEKGHEYALNYSEQVANKYPSDLLIHAEIAKMQFKSGDIGNAFRSAIIAINDESLEAEELAELNYIIGTKYLQEGNLDQSIKFLSSAVNQNSVEKKYYLKLAEVYTDRREINNALSVLNQAINIFPEEATLYYQAGLIHKEQKEYPIAEEFLLKAIQLAPNDMHIRRLHGSVVVLNLIHNRKLARLNTG